MDNRQKILISVLIVIIAVFLIRKAFLKKSSEPEQHSLVDPNQRVSTASVGSGVM